MSEFDIDAALDGGNFVLVGTEFRKIFWAKRDFDWVPVASLGESMGTWAVRTVYIGSVEGDALTEDARVHARAVIRLGRRSLTAWQPVLERYWRDHGDDCRYSMEDVTPLFRPGVGPASYA